MVDQTLLAWAPIAGVLSVAAYFVDYVLTQRTAKAYLSIRHIYAVDGPSDTQPAWVAASESSRIPDRVVFNAVVLLGLMGVLWLFAHAIELNPRLPSGLAATFFGTSSGVILLVQAAALMSHFGNLVQFRALRHPGAATGQIVMSTWLGLRVASIRYVSWAVLWLVLAVISQQGFFVGGSVGSLIVAMRSRNRAASTRMALASQGSASASPASDQAAQQR